MPTGAPRRQENTMGLAGVARGESLPGGDRCLEKGIHLGTRTRFLFHALCTAAYTHTQTYTLRTYRSLARALHYSISTIIYISSSSSSSWSNIHSAHLRQRRKGEKDPSPFFVHTLQYPRLGQAAADHPLSLLWAVRIPSTYPSRPSVGLFCSHIHEGLTIHARVDRFILFQKELYQAAEKL